MKPSEFDKDKGSSPCILDYWERMYGTSSGEERDGSNNAWSGARNNATNSWYINVNNGNVNNTNSYNRYRVCCASELPLPISDELLSAEEDCYKNKHHSMDASRVHYHLSELIPIDNALKDGSWQPGVSTRFMVMKPVPREIYASKYEDRPVHHYVCPTLCRIAEYAYSFAGDISHGNRKYHSAQTAAEQIRDNIRIVSENYTKPCWVATHDIAGFFMNIDKRLAMDAIMGYWKRMPDKMEGDGQRLAELRKIILHDDTSNCELHSPQWMMDLVPPHKRLQPDKGIAIGKYPDQITAGIVLAERDAAVMRLGNVLSTRFVDDCADVAESLDAIKKAAETAETELQKIGLRSHPKKVYIHPYQHGLHFCGRIIKRDRIYVNNSLVRACKNSTRNPYITPERVCESINSYFGLMCHCNTYNIQKKLATEVLQRFGKYLYFKIKKGHFICVLKKAYSPKYKCLYEISEITRCLHRYDSGGGERQRNWRSSHRRRTLC